MSESFYSYTQSRYRNTPTIIHLDGLEYFIDRDRITVTEREDDVFHDVKQGDRLDKLAYEYLGDVRHWWVIADYNNIAFPILLDQGIRLRIPSVKTLEMDILG